MVDDLTIVILTLNEELHLKRCLLNALKLTNNVVVVDSGSIDDTVNIANNLGATVLHLDWPGNHAEQLNNALSQLNLKTEWVLRLDADEYLSDALIDEIVRELPLVESGINGFYLNRRNIFIGKELAFGGMSGTPILRLWRYHYGFCDNRLMDEQIVLLEGRASSFENFFFDDNLSSISKWSEKHIDYSYKEAIQSISGFYDGDGISRVKKIYNKLPLFIRPFLFFLYRYIFRLGFLDGKQGLIWHVLQGFWYRFLVDVQIFKIINTHKDPIGFIHENYPEIFK